MSEDILYLAAAAVTGLVGLGHGLGAYFCLASALRKPYHAHRLRRLVLGLLLLVPAVLLSWYAVKALLAWGT